MQVHSLSPTLCLYCHINYIVYPLTQIYDYCVYSCILNHIGKQKIYKQKTYLYYLLYLTMQLPLMLLFVLFPVDSSQFPVSFHFRLKDSLLRIHLSQRHNFSVFVFCECLSFSFNLKDYFDVYKICVYRCIYIYIYIYIYIFFFFQYFYYVVPLASMVYDEKSA